MNKRYNLDLEQDTITYTPDQDTGQQETFNLSDLVELLAWFKHREQDIRRLVFMSSPIDVRVPLHAAGNGFHVGTCGDRRLVKIKSSVLEDMVKTTEARVRSNWMYDQREQAEYKKGPVQLQQYDREGKEIPLPFPTEFSERDTPDFIIQEALYKIRQVEFWVDRPENMALGRYAKTL